MKAKLQNISSGSTPSIAGLLLIIVAFLYAAAVSPAIPPSFIIAGESLGAGTTDRGTIVVGGSASAVSGSGVAIGSAFAAQSFEEIEVVFPSVIDEVTAHQVRVLGKMGDKQYDLPLETVKLEVEGAGLIISAAGVVTSPPIIGNRPAKIKAEFCGLEAELDITVCDTLLDNFAQLGIDNDGLPDHIQLELGLFSGADDDPDGDGMSNALELAYDSDPLKAEVRSPNPDLVQVTIGNAMRYAMVVRRRAEIPAEYTMQASFDLVTWVDVTDALFAPEPPDDKGFENWAFIATADLSANPRLFLRIKSELTLTKTTIDN